MSFKFTPHIEQILSKNSEAKEWAKFAEDVLPIYNIDTDSRIAHFFSQCCHESSDFKVLEENLNYSKEALLKVFGKYFNEDTAEEYARKPEKIGSRVYQNRMGNSTELTGEGFRYRGRGIIQLTGKDNYIKASESIFKDDTLVKTPEALLTNKPIILHTACWFWDTRKLNDLADKDDCLKITKKINGGTHGLEDRQSRLSKYKLLLKQCGND